MTLAQTISAPLHRPWPRRWVAAAGFAVLAMAAVALWGSGYASRLYFDEANARGNNTLRLAVAVLRGHMERYESLPRVIADFDDIKAVVADPGNQGLVADVNAYLKQINTQFESSDIYVMGEDGTTIVASNYDSEAPFVGENFQYRPYFYDAIDGGEGRFFALGTTSFKRGYYFGAPVLVDGEFKGVVAVKVDVDSIEETWRGGDYLIVVTDPEGIIFMSSRADLLYNSMLPLTPDRLARTAETRRYANAELAELPFRETGDERHRLISIEREETASEYLVVSEAMPEADWTVSVMLDTASARAQALTTTIIALLAIALGTLAGAIYAQRRARLRERMHLQREAKEMLERRVTERTAELASLNIKLEEEVAERRATEQILRKTQSDLIQAGKLAALGQMSAALSHEFNQPLSAARNYADNALVLIERGRIEDASANVGRISGLIDRMNSISRHLRNFARKPNQKLTSVPLDLVIGDTVELLNWRIKSAGIELSLDIGDDHLVIVGGPVRLQQVLVNILTNAIDAAETGTDRRIALTARRLKDRAIVTVRDHGPGVAPGLAERIFDPFFSTKGVGKGLGLGLSISYNIIKDFGGELRVENHPEGGALFTIELQHVQLPAMAEPAQ
ncbi:sensor histidine kinase [Pelagibacterium halotolerans]|uniref:C4-dicarboxylate transport sensor protein DctB n=1 Tax=Pelagibacterium halotolerans (strain DSM 22347 / JCM 15775 / CGMCC 1.7692 / B2) TaxID=1082931 RepID=G4RDJ9_PELHB|nr:ATP-binding protein [Pelagibacterium halotolerans]AEQ51800.1 two-component sensor histidine kinase [Pelagibacterium halotolerans B2]QJR18389.1 sensor histidine kinase [Pelagibacterium halotolerans]